MKKRKIAMVVTKTPMDQEDATDINFWLGRPAWERIAEVTRLRRQYYTWRLGEFPDHMEKTIFRKKLNV